MKAITRLFSILLSCILPSYYFVKVDIQRCITNDVTPRQVLIRNDKTKRKTLVLIDNYTICNNYATLYYKGDIVYSDSVIYIDVEETCFLKK